MTDIDVSPEVMRAHAGKLAAVQSAISLAEDAAGEASISDNSLGLLVGPLIVGPFLIAETAAKSTIRSAKNSVDRLGEQLVEAANDIEDHEQTWSDVISGYESTVEAPPVMGQPTDAVSKSNLRISPNLIARLG